MPLSFQAEDGIRDWSVTGVQTCALPIYLLRLRTAHAGVDVGGVEQGDAEVDGAVDHLARGLQIGALRSEERRVGTSVGCGWRRRGGRRGAAAGAVCEEASAATEESTPR